MEDEFQKRVDEFNERLRVAGLEEAFNEAVNNRDENDFKDVLKKLDLSDDEIAVTLSQLSGLLMPKGFDPNGFVPRDKHDHESANRAIAAGYPAVKPVLTELLEWIQDMNWPVAQTLTPFLASIGLPLAPYIKNILETDDDIWKYWIFKEIFLRSAELAEAFRDELERIVVNPTESERIEELPEEASKVLKHYGWH